MSERQATAVFDAFCAGVLLVFFAFVLSGCAATNQPGESSEELRVPIFGGGIERSRSIPQPPAAPEKPTGIEALQEAGEIMAVETSNLVTEEAKERQSQETDALKLERRQDRMDRAENCAMKVRNTLGYSAKDSLDKECDCYETYDVFNTFYAKGKCGDEKPLLEPSANATPFVIDDTGGGPIELEPSDIGDKMEIEGAKASAYAAVEQMLRHECKQVADANCIDGVVELIYASGKDGSIGKAEVCGLTARPVPWVADITQRGLPWVLDSAARDALEQIQLGCPGGGL